MTDDTGAVLIPTGTNEVTITFQPSGIILSLGVSKVAFDKFGEPIGINGKLWHGAFLLSRETLYALKSVVDAAAVHLGKEEYSTIGEVQVTKAN